LVDRLWYSGDMTGKGTSRE